MSFLLDEGEECDWQRERLREEVWSLEAGEDGFGGRGGSSTWCFVRANVLTNDDGEGAHTEMVSKAFIDLLAISKCPRRRGELYVVHEQNNREALLLNVHEREAASTTVRYFISFRVKERKSSFTRNNQRLSFIEK